jgi:DNA-directed RNA polymerase
MVDFSEFPAEHVDASSKYLAKKTFESLNEMFTASQEIQDWLTQCAKVRTHRRTSEKNDASFSCASNWFFFLSPAFCSAGKSVMASLVAHVI